MVLPCNDDILARAKSPFYICAIFNLVLAVPTTLMNASFIVAVLKSSDRAEPYQILMLNLAITDLLTGIVSMPSQFISYLHNSHFKETCFNKAVAENITFFLGMASFFTVIAVTMERYTYVFHPFFYNEKLTSRFLTAMAGSIWLLSIALSVAYSFTGGSYLINTCIGVLASALIFFCYTRIMLRARRVRRQIAAEAGRYGQRRMNKKDKNLVVIGGLIIISFFVCYAPTVLSNLLLAFGIRSHIFRGMYYWLLLLVLSNSFINPMISCTFNPRVRRKVIRIWSCGRKGRTH
eukprot:gene3616-13878_t